MNVDDAAFISSECYDLMIEIKEAIQNKNPDILIDITPTLELISSASNIDEIKAIVSEKMEDGFSVKATDIPKNNRAARMIAFFGYTFIDSIEQVWMKLTESQLQDVDMVCRELTAKINEILSARRSVRKEGTP